MKKSELVKIIKEAVIAKRALNEEKGNSLDQLMTDLGDAILADDIEAMKKAGRALLSKAKGKLSQGAEKLKGHLEKKYK